MEKETYIYYKDKWVKNPSKWIMFKRNIKLWIRKWKLVDTSKYKVVSKNDLDRYFILTPKEREDANKLYKDEKRTLSYEFYPCSGIGWGVRVHDLKTKETFDITDIESW